MSFATLIKEETKHWPEERDLLQSYVNSWGPWNNLTACTDYPLATRQGLLVYNLSVSTEYLHILVTLTLSSRMVAVLYPPQHLTTFHTAYSFHLYVFCYDSHINNTLH